MVAASAFVWRFGEQTEDIQASKNINYDWSFVGYAGSHINWLPVFLRSRSFVCAGWCAQNLYYFVQLLYKYIFYTKVLSRIVASFAQTKSPTIRSISTPLNMSANNYLPRIPRRFLRTRIRPLIVRPPPPRRLSNTGEPMPVVHEEVFTPPPQIEEKAPTLPGLTEYAYRWDTAPPSMEQLMRADKFFKKYPVVHLWSEAKFKMIDHGTAPEVCGVVDVQFTHLLIRFIAALTEICSTGCVSRAE